MTPLPRHALVDPLFKLFFALTCTLCLAWVAGPAMASASEPLPPALVPEVLVSATRLSTDATRQMRQVVILDSAEIARRGASSIADLLATVTGVDAQTRGPFGTQVDLGMDGATYSQVVILVDGMRVNDPQTDHHTLNLPLTPADLARVEILHGAASSVHGVDAVGGVINLVPRAASGVRLDIATRRIDDIDGGDAGTGSDINLRIGTGNEQRGVTLSAGRLRSDGYRETTDADEDRLFLLGHSDLGGGRLSVQAGWQDKGFGARDFYAPFPSREWTTAHLAGARYERRVGTTMATSRVYVRRHTDRFVLIESDPSVYENNHTSWMGGGEAHVRRAMAGGQVAAGAEWTREQIDSSNLGEHTRDRWGGFAEYGTARGAWQLNAGLRADHHQGAGWEAAPTISIGRRLNDRSRAYATVARAYRAPSFTEFYYTDPNHVGNPDLAAERSWQYEIGASTRVAQTSLQGAVFLRQEQDLVDYVRATDTPPWVAQNLGEMQTLGVRVSGARQFGPVDTQIGYTFVDKEQTLASGLQSKYVFSHPRHQANVRLRHALPAQITADWSVQARERIAPLDDYARVDLLVRRPVEWGELRLRATNLFDDHYEEILGVPLPGRWFGAEASLNL
jgi:vitamin B12 transporter